MRASNVDAALYYLARMIEAGEDPLFIARRMVVFASEDIGMAQPTALVIANDVFRACETMQKILSWVVHYHSRRYGFYKIAVWNAHYHKFVLANPFQTVPGDD